MDRLESGSYQTKLSQSLVYSIYPSCGSASMIIKSSSSPRPSHTFYYVSLFPAPVIPEFIEIKINQAAWLALEKYASEQFFNTQTYNYKIQMTVINYIMNDTEICTQCVCVRRRYPN